jgi:hypothetical protein
MEYFWSDGGNNRPVFRYRIKVPKCTSEMFKWCEGFDDEGKYFRRWHVEWKKFGDKDYDVVQFEWYDAAVMFKLTWGGSDI